MMKNTKGFTLIELLAVIVILAVIALIATPIIMNVINEAKSGADSDAALGYVKAVENAIATDMIKNPNMTVTAAQTTLNKVKCTSCGTNGTATEITVNYKGTNPTAVNLTYSEGKITGDVTYGTGKYDAVTGAKK